MMHFENDLKHALTALRKGGLILYPTDTIWGIGCDATDEDAVQRIFGLKKRDGSKSLVVLMADVKDLGKYLSQPPPDMADIVGRFDRPTTVIYEGALHLAPNVIHDDGSVAIRLVKDPFCRHLIKRLRKPLVSTSANISGMLAPAGFYDIPPEIVAGVDYVVKYRQDDATRHQPSRIVRIGKEGKLEVLRP